MTSQRTAGFTLIELLIVIVIISIVASFATLSINFNQDKRLESLSNQLANLIILAEQEALLRTVTISFRIQKNKFQFYEFHPTVDPKKSPWHALTHTSWGQHDIPSDVKIVLKAETQQIIISPSGDITPFTILIGKKDQAPHYRIIGEANGTAKSERIDEE